MGSRRNSPLCSLWLVSALLLVFIAESGRAEAPPTFEQELARLGIPLTKPSLLRALRSAKPEVRGLAAAELATMKAVDTLPDILRAANEERDDRTRENIAAAATWLGSSEAMSLLTRMCQNASLSASVRQSAASTLFDAGRYDCYSSMAAMMWPSGTPEERVGAMYLLTQLHGRTREQSEEVLRLTLSMLAEPDLRLRLEACSGLRFLRNPAAIAPLREALLREQVEVVRQQIQAALASLTSTT